MDEENGSGTILSLGLMGAIGLILSLMVFLAVLFDTQQKAVNSADFAALAVAEVLNRPADKEPCRVAHDVVEDADLVSCVIKGNQVEIQTTAHVEIFGMELSIPARSLAGPG